MAKDALVVDSSVVAKWYLVEEGSGAAISIRDEFATGKLDLAVPTLMFYEVVNALRFSGAFSGVELELAARSLGKYGFQAWRPRGRFLELATKMSFESGVTVYDASYVALAKMRGCKAVTEDRELLERFPGIAVPLSEFNGEG